MAKLPPRIVRVYADTSVFGGVYDDEFATASEKFFARVRREEFSLVTSDLVRRELQGAPERVRQLFQEILLLAEVTPMDRKALEFQGAYLKAGVVPEDYSDDALHVALATVSECDMIVSWNFRHIVNYERIPLYSAVNILNGYRGIAIYSPMEVVGYEDEDI